MLETRLLSSRRQYLLAISGGRDSVCLLHLLSQQGFRNLHLIHLNHQLRGQESEDDARFVTDLAQKLALPLTLEKTSIAQRAQDQGESIETAARHARHQLFAKVARETNCSRILLAHHAEDQAETCLFNLLRGSSGLKGMLLENEFLIDQKKLTFLRPLLNTRRTEIDQYLKEHAIPYREDQSNRDLCYSRNRLRHEALPLLTDILQRDIIPPIIRALETSREHQVLISQIITSLQLRDPQGRLFLPKIRELPPELQRACLKQFLEDHQIPQISNSLLQRTLTLIPSDGPPALNLPGNRFLRRKEGRLFLT